MAEKDTESLGRLGLGDLAKVVGDLDDSQLFVAEWGAQKIYRLDLAVEGEGDTGSGRDGDEGRGPAPDARPRERENSTWH